MADGQVVFEISADGKKAMASIEDITKAFEKAGKQWDSTTKDAADNMGNSMSSAFKKISAAAAAAGVAKVLTTWGKAAIQAASDLEEVQNVVDVTFGEGARQIETWAKTAQTQFGLTETQAKRFTSTLGAMMKSAGLAGHEIVSMSTDLAGLAADMASFYNLDFDTAFQKIRSGISGETEPLKQLGINMSVANLEAYALTQGITKAFDKMSQSEQTILRYQYLMQATADAQGDFARTSDGYANSVRLLETNLDSLKAKIGTVLLPVVNTVVGALNSLFGALTAEPETTILDEFASIDTDTSRKMAEIEATATKAWDLIAVLSSLSAPKAVQTGLTDFISTLADDIDGLDKALATAKKGDYAGTMAEIADALSAKFEGTDASDWQTLLFAIGQNLPTAAEAAEADGGATAAFLEAAGAAADALGGDYPALWEDLLTVLGDEAGDALAALSEGAAGAEAMAQIVAAANGIDSTSSANWTKLLSAIGEVGALDTTSADGINALADALSGKSVNTTRAQAFSSLIGTLTDNAESLSALTGKSAEETKAWLEGLAESAETLDPTTAEGWDTLMSALTEGLPGLEDTEAGQEFLKTVGAAMTELSTSADMYRQYLEIFGINAEGIADPEAEWLKLSQELIKTIPGIGEVLEQESDDMGQNVRNLQNFVNDWKAEQEKLLMWKAYYAKQDALQTKQNQLAEYELEAGAARVRRDRLKAEWQKLYNEAEKSNLFALYGEYLEQGLPVPSAMQEQFDAVGKAMSAYTEAEDDLSDAQAEYNKQLEAYGLGAEKQADTLTYLKEEYGELEESIDGATGAQERWNATQEEAASTAFTAALDALTAVDTYYQQIRDETARSIERTVSGFESITTPAEKAKSEMEDLTKQIEQLNAAGQDTSGLEKTYSETGKGIPSIQKMNAALRDQLAYLTEYQDNLAKARAAGVSEDILAFLSDGSAESFDYLAAIASGQYQQGDIDELNRNWAAVQSAKEGFTDELTDTRLKADDEFQMLLDNASAAIEQMDLADGAKSAMEATVQGIADGIAEKIPTVEAQINSLFAVLSSLNNAGFGYTTSGGFTYGSGGGGLILHPHADGLDFVPFDNYLARLHEGESILTAEEAKVWRDFKQGGASSRNSIDYGALSGAIWDNAPQMGGGNVYLDGQTVGRVISTQQGNSYRALERSGWQR